MKAQHLGLALALLCGQSFGANQDIQDLIGTYEGISHRPEWKPDEPEKCSVTVSVNNKREVEIVLKVEAGIPLYTRHAKPPIFRKSLVSELRFPNIKVNKFLKAAKREDGYYLIQGDYRLHISHLDEVYGRIQLNYEKTDPTRIYDGVLAYTDSLTGCYDVRKVK